MKLKHARKPLLRTLFAAAVIAVAANVLRNQSTPESMLLGLDGQPVDNKVFYQQILSYRSQSRPPTNLDAKEGTGWFMADPQSGKKIYVYSYDCDEPKLKKTIKAERLSIFDLFKIWNFCTYYKERVANASRNPLEHKIEGKIPFFLISQNTENESTNLLAHVFGLSKKEIPLLNTAEDELIALRHEEGHTIDQLLGGVPEDIDGIDLMWGEGFADAYAILTATRDSRSLYAAAVWTQFRIAATLPNYNGRHSKVQGIDYIYFNPYILEAGLEKASTLLKDNTLFEKSDIELAHIARAITKKHIMPSGSASQYIATYLNTRKTLNKTSENMELFMKAGGYSEDDGIIKRIRRAIRFFQFMEEQNLTPRPLSGNQNPVQPSVPFRHSAS